MDDPDGEKCESPAEKSEAILKEVPISPPPIAELDLTIVENKCDQCKVPLSLYVDFILNINADKLYDVECVQICKSCTKHSDLLLPWKNDLVQKYLRNFVTPNSEACPETLKCQGCNKPCSTNFRSIKYLKNNDDDTVCTFDCKSCKKTNRILIPYKSEPVQKLLLKLCN